MPAGRRFASVRIRTTAGATLVVAIALGLGSLTLISILRSTMVDNIDTALRLRASDIASIVDGGTIPADVAVDGPEDAFVQIVDPNGVVLASSRNIAGQAPVTVAATGIPYELSDGPVDAGAFRAYAVEGGFPRAVTIVVGRSLEEVDSTMRVVITWSFVVSPVLALLVAAITWIVVGRAFKPVDEIRAQVADIGGGDLHRRVRAPRSDDEIGRLATTMNEMLGRLEDASERQRRFVSDASHELRTPIATIRHELEVARVVTPEDLDSLLDDIGEENSRMQHLVDDLLLLAREDQAQRDAEDAVGHHERVDIDELALVEAHRRRSATIVIDASQLVPVQTLGDERQLARVVSNLVDNAVRHASMAVELHTEVVDDRVLLHVDDDGPGVPVDDRERIFERFTRADDARSRTGGGGAGLGLAIARDLASNHRGSVTVSNSPVLGGARFTLSVPISDRPD